MEKEITRETAQEKTGNGRYIAYLVLLVIIFTMGLYLRMEVVLGSVVDEPVRADAAEYYLYAYNLKAHGIYSKQKKLGEENLIPDSARPPGYPLFILPFVQEHPTDSVIYYITLTQAMLGALTILLGYLLFTRFLHPSGALAASFLVAISPHLINMHIYILSETLFTLLLVLTVFMLSLLVERGRLVHALLVGIVLGLALLVRDTLLYFLIVMLPFLFFSLGKQYAKRWMLIILVMIGFSVSYGPWFIYKQINGLDSGGAATAVLHKGMYPNLMYRDDPQTRGMPNHYDPDWSKRNTLSEVAEEIIQRFKQEPLQYLEWYALGKISMFFSWSMVMGTADIFLYPMIISPYHAQNSLLGFTHYLSKILHWPLVILALSMVVWAWTPWSNQYLSETGKITVRFISLIFIYFIAVHVITLPLPRYAFPLKPLMFAMSCLALQVIFMKVKDKYAKS